MARKKRTSVVITGQRGAQLLASVLGGEAQRTRRARRLTQGQLGNRVGLSQSEISHIERGNGQGTPLETWVAIGIALDRPLAVGFSREIAIAAQQGARHLAAQELVLRLGARNGRSVRFELPTRPSNPSLSIDVCLRQRRTARSWSDIPQSSARHSRARRWRG